MCDRICQTLVIKKNQDMKNADIGEVSMIEILVGSSQMFLQNIEKR